MHVAGDDCAGVLSQGGTERIPAKPGTRVCILYMCILEYSAVYNMYCNSMHRHA